MGHAEVLGVHPTATRSEIKAAFREAAKAVHPDINHSPEANEAFARIKVAHDALIAQAGNETEQASVKSVAASSARATARAAYQMTPPPPPVTVATDTTPRQTPEEVAAERELDRLASKKPGFIHRQNEPPAVKKHRQKLRAASRRIQGKY